MCWCSPADLPLKWQALFREVQCPPPRAEITRMSTRATRAWTLLGLVIFAALSLAVSRYWENVLLTSIHGNSGTVRRDQAEYFASTWLVAFIVSSVAAAWTLVGMITKRSSAHGHHEQF